MCGIIGFNSSDVRDLQLAAFLLEESQIRGKHSTGVSYISTMGLTTLKSPIPSKEFVKTYWNKIEEDIGCYGVVNLIAHTRYSTSGSVDIINAQPIADEHLSISMNGVITQSSPENWKSEFGVDCKTTNDTEIAHIKMKSGINPLNLSKSRDDVRFSMAICSLWESGNIEFFRNGRRPQYFCNLKWHSNFSIVASTKEIIYRALRKIDTSINIISMGQTTPGEVYRLGNGFVEKVSSVNNINLEDWQLEKK